MRVVVVLAVLERLVYWVVVLLYRVCKGADSDGGGGEEALQRE